MLFIKNYKSELTDYVSCNKKLFSSFSDKSFFIIGAAGLIGSYIIDLIIVANELFNTNITVYAADKDAVLLNERFPDCYNNTVKKFVFDINENVIPVNYADYVIHAASNTSPTDYATKPVATMRTNIIGTDRLLSHFSCKNTKRFMFCSSVEAYGQNNGDVDEFTEDYSGYVNCNTLRAGYPSAKRASEALCNAYAEENENFEFVIARIGRIYGPTVISGDAKAPTQFIMNAVKGEDIVLKSAGTQEFSYGYVGDCATAMLYILIKGENGNAYNIADPASRVLLRDFAQSCASAGGKKLVTGEPTAAEKAGYSKITKAVMNTDKLVSLGWEARFNVNDGVLRTVNYLKELTRGKF